MDHSQSSILGTAGVTKDFNDEVKVAFDDVVVGLVGPKVLVSLYQHLETHYGLSGLEVPYRLDTLSEVLENVFGEAGARTIGKAVAKRLYFRLSLDFHDAHNYILKDYLEQAKKELVRR